MTADRAPLDPTSPRKIAVIGSNSFSGSDFVDYVLREPRTRVLGIGRSPELPRVFLPYKECGTDRFEFARCDMNARPEELIARLDAFAPDYVVNFAALTEVAASWTHPADYYATNVVSLARLLPALRERAYLRRFVQISSPEVYGGCEGEVREDAPLNPSTPYAASKAAADLLLQAYCKTYGFPAVTVRSTNVYGAHQLLHKIIPRAILKLDAGETIELHGGGVAVKSFVHIRDVSRGEEAIMTRGAIGGVYHLSPERGYAVREVVERICALMGRDFHAATRAVEERPGQDAAYVISSRKARAELGWEPRISLEEGLRSTIAWIERSRDELRDQSRVYVHAA